MPRQLLDLYVRVPGANTHAACPPFSNTMWTQNVLGIVVILDCWYCRKDVGVCAFRVFPLLHFVLISVVDTRVISHDKANAFCCVLSPSASVHRKNYGYLGVYKQYALAIRSTALSCVYVTWWGYNWLLSSPPPRTPEFCSLCWFFFILYRAFPDSFAVVFFLFSRLLQSCCTSPAVWTVKNQQFLA